ncbi:putative oxidoreductase [Gordonia namibiensis NBRC 108229]|uniref:Putative oxidoreductase n=1 Tax=Gordonia namibiensis NBRC 108229 TaxID=1208314 RepID=K6XCI0_9ACTN|nr:LLM class F420-dependent oxidoreductase [Gordonia namibiensis]GAC02103.1 putative oxidoreductase [Gordonia namibiensis NBRC 108229]
MTRLGYQIANFTYPDVPADQLFPTVVAQAQEAENSGFDTVFAMDHFYQLPMLGEPHDPMFECYTLLSALAQHTSAVRLSSLVTGNTYRNPTLLAKTVTALDIVSGGRGQLGIGAGWYELEHDSLGFEFGTFTDRFERLEEALQIIRGMLAGERPSLDGKRYQVSEALNVPAPLSRIPVMIGGAGEQKTLRMVAQYADESNLLCPPNHIPRKLDVLAEHCDRRGRERSEITVSIQTYVCMAPTHDEAVAEYEAYVERTPAAEVRRRMTIIGDPDEVAARYADMLAAGVDGFTVNAAANGHVPGRVSLLGETLAPLLG